VKSNVYVVCGLGWCGACGLLQDVLCGMLDIVGAVYFGQCEGDRVVVWCV
jgi:hypothetical protein